MSEDPKPEAGPRVGATNWDLAGLQLGDYIEVEIRNRVGDRNLDGCVLSGRIIEIVPEHNMVRLSSGWCAHTKDKLVSWRRTE